MHFITVVSLSFVLFFYFNTNLILSCYSYLDIPDKSNLVYKSTSDEKLIYSLWCSDATNYLKTINSAYMFASNSLLNVLLIDYDLINRLK